jgi:hypothetical protein
MSVGKTKKILKTFSKKYFTGFFGAGRLIRNGQQLPMDIYLKRVITYVQNVNAVPFETHFVIQ